MYGHYEYGSEHTVDGSSSQPNPFGSLSLKRSKSRPRRRSQNRRRQTASKKNPHNEKVGDQRCCPWTPKKETALCKGWVHTSEDSVKGNARKERGFWVDILKYMQETCLIIKRQTYDMVNEKWKTVRLKVASFCGVYANTILTYTSGVGDVDYLQRALTDYHVEYEVSFTLLHCWDVLKECDKWKSGEVPLFMQKREEKMNKRYKSTGSSSFNTRESGEGGINLNTTVGDEEDEVEEVRRPLPMAIFISRTTF
ncbi:RNA-directed DNA polymerase, eukaryota [Tanacetum coccineum]